MAMPALKQIIRDLGIPRPPFWMVAAAVIFVVLTWLPLAIIARARATRSPHTAVHIFHDMDHQPKYKAQSASGIFVDGRAMRPPVPGTVPRGRLDDDDHYHRGFVTDGHLDPVFVKDAEGNLSRTWISGFPDRVTVNERFVRRGRKMFNIFCFPCHGRDGYGKGPVNERALMLMANLETATVWTPAANLHQIDKQSGKLKYGQEFYPEGRLFNVISNGFNNMPAYGSQIDTENRWAIVAYIRALQLSQHAPEDLVPAAKRRTMR